MIKNTILQTKQSFENYIPYAGNSFAVYVAKEMLSSSVGELHYNGLYLYGNGGVGKTHLLKAIKNSFKKKQDVVYCTMENFLNELTYNIRAMTMDKFRNKFRTSKLLMIDDFEYIQGKDEAQKELYHTLETLDLKGSKFIISSGKPLDTLEIAPSLKNILYSTIIQEIEPPNNNTIEEIVRNLCQRMRLQLKDEIVIYIAKKSKGNSFKAKGIIYKLYTQYAQKGQDITMKQLKETIRGYFKKETLMDT